MAQSQPKHIRVSLSEQASPKRKASSRKFFRNHRSLWLPKKLEKCSDSSCRKAVRTGICSSATALASIVPSSTPQDSQVVLASSRAFLTPAALPTFLPNQRPPCSQELRPQHSQTSNSNGRATNLDHSKSAFPRTCRKSLERDSTTHSLATIKPLPRPLLTA